jgi:DNA-binding response OmpR family regulator
MEAQMEVLLLTEEPDFESVLPSLGVLAGSVRSASITDSNLVGDDPPDVAIVDARTDLSAARAVCARLAAAAPSVAVVPVVSEADVVAVDIDWRLDEVVLAGAHAAELDARLRLAIGRRRGAQEDSRVTLKFGDLVLHPASYCAFLGDRELDLTLTEFRLLNYLVEHAGRAFTRSHLMHTVWGHDCSGRARTVDVHVQRLRAKLGADYESLVDTVRGIGYMAVNQPHQPSTIGESPQRVIQTAGAA